MDFDYGQTVYRDRRRQITDPYNPGTTVEGDFDPALTVALEGAFVASSSSSSLANATRVQILTAKSLFLTDPTADVRARDQIRVGTDTYQVEERPAADMNPFTGWQPAVEIPIVLVEG